MTAELSGLDPQSLRLYERRGLLTPARTDGGTRRYSDDDLARLQRITELLAEGVNLAGIALILDLEARNEARDRLSVPEAENKTGPFSEYAAAHDVEQERRGP